MADLPVTIDAASRDERKTEGQSDDDDTTPYSVVNFPTLSAASHTVKEAKQHLGFLAEQTTRFASHTASIHLCAIRYLMLVHAKLEGLAVRIGDARSSIQDQLNAMSLAGHLWQLFRAVISGSLCELQERLNCSVETIMQAIDERSHDFLVRSLQLDAFTMRLEHEQ